MLNVVPNLQTGIDRVLGFYFNYCRERYSILLKRRAGFPQEKWTEDPILKAFRFTNVFREDDAMTIWFREHIREPLRDDARVLMAIIACRWFNKIETGEALRPLLLGNIWDQEIWRSELNKVKQRDGTICTGAYMIKTPAAMSKIDGILQCLWKAKQREEELLYGLTRSNLTQQQCWERLCTLDYIGGFTANEIIVDLTHTFFLENASDIMSWTNPGPGGAAGIGLLLYGDRKKFNRTKDSDRAEMINIMSVFLKASQEERYWPQDWPRFTLHTIQFNFCEIFKYMQGQAGFRLKRRYR